MNLVPQNIDEAIKHLSGRSQEEINEYIQEILKRCGYTPKIKRELLKAINLELAENKRRYHTKPAKSVEFISYDLNMLKVFLKHDFVIINKDEPRMIEYLSGDLKNLIKKYNLK